jgi:hypothetical protein
LFKITYMHLLFISVKSLSVKFDELSTQRVTQMSKVESITLTGRAKVKYINDQGKSEMFTLNISKYTNLTSLSFNEIICDATLLAAGHSNVKDLYLRYVDLTRFEEPTTSTTTQNTLVDNLAYWAAVLSCVEKFRYDIAVQGQQTANGIQGRTERGITFCNMRTAPFDWRALFPCLKIISFTPRGNYQD